MASPEYAGSENEASRLCTVVVVEASLKPRARSAGDQRLSVDGLAVAGASTMLLIATGWPRDDAENPA